MSGYAAAIREIVTAETANKLGATLATAKKLRQAVSEFGGNAVPTAHLA